MDKLLLNDKTRLQLEVFINRPAQTLLLVAPPGSGKATVARALAAELLSIKTEKLQNHPYLFTVTAPAGKKEVPIDSIRQLIRDLSLRVPSENTGSYTRMVIIEDAHLLSIEAQNALLKLLEEPPASTVIILNVINENDLLPTVVSRAQKINILPPSLKRTTGHFKEFQPDKVEASWRLSGGAVGMVSALLSNRDHPLRQAVEAVKKFLVASPYHRLLQLQELARDPAAFNDFLRALSMSLGAIQNSAINRGTSPQQKLLTARRLLAQAADHRSANTNMKLLYLHLCLNFNL